MNGIDIAWKPSRRPRTLRNAYYLLPYMKSYGAIVHLHSQISLTVPTLSWLSSKAVPCSHRKYSLFRQSVYFRICSSCWVLKFRYRQSKRPISATGLQDYSVAIWFPRPKRPPGIPNSQFSRCVSHDPCFTRCATRRATSQASTSMPISGSAAIIRNSPSWSAPKGVGCIRYFGGSGQNSLLGRISQQI